jgi:lysozyme
MSQEFIDISEFQPHVDFHALAKTGICGVMIRATYGSKSVDAELSRHVRGAKDAGLPIALYHYAYPNLHHADVEAAHFCEVAAHFGSGVPLMLDMEEGQASPSYTAWCRAFNHVCHSRRGVWPYFYSYAPYMQLMKIDKPIGRGLIIANYGPNDGHRHPVDTPKPWRNLAAHQYTSKGRVSGIPGNVDRDYAFVNIFRR